MGAKNLKILWTSYVEAAHCKDQRRRWNRLEWMEIQCQRGGDGRAAALPRLKKG